MHEYTISQLQRILAATALILLCLIVSLAVNTPVLAQETTPTPAPENTTLPATQRNKGGDKKQMVQQKMETKKENVQQRIETKKDNLGQRLETRKENLVTRVENRASNTEQRIGDRKEHIADAAKARIHAYTEKMWRRFNAAVLRLEKLADRIGARIAKFEQGGANMAEPKQLLEQARKEISEARSAITEAKTAVETAVSSENPKQAFEQTRTIIQNANEKIKAAHNSLVQAIRVMRANTPERPAAATTSEQN